MATSPVSIDGALGPPEAARAWFAALQECVGGADFARGRGLFASDVVSFGSRVTLARGLDVLEASQWRGVWPYVVDFAFELGELHVGALGPSLWAAVPWRSTGFDEAGAPFDRPGRATVVLERREGRWVAVHSHFSLVPGTPARSFGRRT